MLHFIAGLAIGICGTLCAVYIAPIIIRGILPEARELGSGFAAERGRSSERPPSAGPGDGSQAAIMAEAEASRQHLRGLS